MIAPTTQPPLRARLALAELIARNILIAENITAPPVPVERLLGESAFVHWYEDPKEEGFCIMGDDGPHAFLNKTMIKGCDAFTLAHELGHIKMGHIGIDQDLITPSLERNIKLEADYFAYCLLMPERWIRGAVGGGRRGCEHIRGLAHIFGVSYSSMNKRLARLGLYHQELIHRTWGEIQRR